MKVTSEGKLAYSFMAPAAVVIGLVIGYPIINIFNLSTMRKPVGFPGDPVGTENYATAVGDNLFQHSIYVSAIYAVVAVTFKLLIGLGIALVLNENFKGRAAVRAAVIVPWTIPVYTTSMLFYWIYNYELGLLNIILTDLGLNSVSWLGTQNALPSLIILNIWKGIPFFAIGLLAALGSIPKALYESAELDGASAIRRFMHITLPGVKGVVLIVSMLSFIWSYGEFTPAYILTQGGPAHATELIGLRIFYATFGKYELGFPSSMSVLLLPIFVPLILIIARLIRR